VNLSLNNYSKNENHYAGQTPKLYAKTNAVCMRQLQRFCSSVSFSEMSINTKING